MLKYPEIQHIVFLHIPKAAGTTLNTILVKQFSSREIFSVYGERDRSYENELRAMNLEDLINIKLVNGHIPFGVHDLLPGPTGYVTILRDPIERILSYYRYALSEPTMHIYNEVKKNEVSLHEFVTSKLTLQVDNLQTRLLSGIGYTLDFDKCTEEMLFQAKKNIEEMFVVTGLASHFDETLLLLGDCFAFRRLHYEKKNVSSILCSELKVSNEDIYAIRERNSLDIDLYQWAEQRFLEVVDNIEFKKRLSRFQLLNRLYGQLFPLALKTKRGLTKLTTKK